MALLANSAEGGSNTTLVSAANSGGSSGDAWSSVNRTSAASAYTFSSSFPAHGSLGYAIQAATGEACQLIWTYVGGSGAASLFYYRHPGTPTATSELAQLRSSTPVAAKISIGTDSKLILQNAAGANARVSPTALVTGDEVWISFRALKGVSTVTGTLEYAWGYKGSATIVDSFSSATVNAGTTDFVSSRFGRTNGSTWVTTFHLDSIESDTNATALIASREQRNQTASVSLSVATSLALAGVPAVTAAPSLATSTSLAAAGVPAVSAALALPVSTALTEVGAPTVTGDLAPAVSTALTVAVAPALSVGADLAVSTSLTADLAPSLDAAADAFVSVLLTAESTPNYPAAEPGPLVPLPHLVTLSTPDRSLRLTTPAHRLTLTAARRTLVPTNPPED